MMEILGGIIFFLLFLFIAKVLYRIMESLDSMKSTMSNFLREYMEEIRHQAKKDEDENSN